MEIKINTVTGFTFIVSESDYRFCTEESYDGFFDYANLSDRQTKRLLKALDTYDKSKIHLLVHRNADKTRMYIKELDIVAHGLEDLSFTTDD